MKKTDRWVLVLNALMVCLMAGPSSYADETSSAIQIQSLYRGYKERKIQQEIDQIAKKLWDEDLHSANEELQLLAGIQENYGSSDLLMPEDLKNIILDYLNPLTYSRCSLTKHQNLSQNTARARVLYRAHQLKKIKQHLPNFIELPAVTADDVTHLQQAQVQTSITNPMPAFKAADVKNSIGLYYAVMGSYPDLSLVDDAERAAQYSAWKANPDLPLTYTTAAQDSAFARRLSLLTGRKFLIMNEAQNEYMRRGRTGDTADASQGNITTTKYHFGDSDEEVKHRAFISGNPLSQNRPHGVHEIPADAREGAYKNARGFIHPIGNVFERSPNGVVRGGAFRSYEWSAESSNRDEGFADYLYDVIGSRLVELRHD